MASAEDEQPTERTLEKDAGHGSNDEVSPGAGVGSSRRPVRPLLNHPEVVARLLGRLDVPSEGWCDAFFERLEVLENGGPRASPGVVRRREQGLSVRIADRQRSWMSSCDRIDGTSLVECCRDAARVAPRAVLSAADFDVSPWWTDGASGSGSDLEDANGWPGLETEEGSAATAMREFPLWIAERLKQRRVAFDHRYRLRRIRRVTQVVRRRVVPEPIWEQYFDLSVVTSRTRWGTLVPILTSEQAASVADRLAATVLARTAPQERAGRYAVVLGSHAAAVLLHEAVAHALEADLLFLSGRPDHAHGVRLGSEVLDVLDSPASAPFGLSRPTDDEGVLVGRRWLLRRGAVEEPLADRHWAATGELTPGAARRANRHQLPMIRSSHLELLAGDRTIDQLLQVADGGLYVDELDGGRIDPMTGRVTLQAPWAHRIEGGELTERRGPLLLRGGLTEMLTAVVGVGTQRRLSGAGWCAKGGQRNPVWATSPPIVLGAVDVEPRQGR